MVSAAQSLARNLDTVVPSTMKAAVYRGINDVRIETVPVPEIGPGELLIRVHTCGICGTGNLAAIAAPWIEKRLARIRR